MNDTKILRILYVVIVILAINVATTGYIVFYISTHSQQSSSTTSTTKQIARDKAQYLAKNVIERYNTKDVAGLYSQFDALAKIKFTQDKLTDTVEKIHSMAGKVDGYEYSYTAPAGKKEGREFLTLFYKLRLSNGTFPAGQMKLTVTQEGDRLALFGFFIDLNQE